MPRPKGYKVPQKTGKTSAGPFPTATGNIQILTLNGDGCYVNRSGIERLIQLAELSGQPVHVTWLNPFREARTDTPLKTMAAGGAA